MSKMYEDEVHKVRETDENFCDIVRESEGDANQSHAYFNTPAEVVSTNESKSDEFYNNLA